MPRLLSDGAHARFSLVFLLPDGPLMEGLRTGRLKHRDAALLWLLLLNVRWRYARCWLTIDEMAAALGGVSTGTVERSLARLRREQLVAQGWGARTPRRQFWCLNPWLVAATGGRGWRLRQMEQFSHWIEASDPAPLDAEALALLDAEEAAEETESRETKRRRLAPRPVPPPPAAAKPKRKPRPKPKHRRRRTAPVSSFDPEEMEKRVRQLAALVICPELLPPEPPPRRRPPSRNQAA